MTICETCKKEFRPKSDKRRKGPPRWCSGVCYYARSGGTPESRLQYRRDYMRDYMRDRRGVTQVRPKRTNGSGSFNKDTGYRYITAHGHPVAMARGVALEHRVVLFDAIGPGDHPCHWCGASVTWEKRYPQKGALVVDHFDGDRVNNALENLLVSCRPCNTSMKMARGEIVALRREVVELRAALAAALA